MNLLCRYREAKTKFIFEPKTGIMHWEQKLPMSWHAFNETPKFDVSNQQRLSNRLLKQQHTRNL